MPMTSEPGLESQSPDRPTTQPAARLPIDARAIQPELARVWHEAAAAAPPGGGGASSQTLVLIVTEPSLIESAETALGDVAGRHRCRVIQVVVGETEPLARLNARCPEASPGQAPACWEIVRLEGGRSALP